MIMEKCVIQVENEKRRPQTIKLCTKKIFSKQLQPGIADCVIGLK